ncbi:6-bladed beta-propeller [Gemmatimonadota bacterium]
MTRPARSGFQPVRLRYLSLLPGLCLLLTACSADSGSSSEAGHGFRTFEEDGITISESSGGPKYEGDIFTFEELFELDQDESRPESFLHVNSGYVMDEDGLIFVFDSADGRVVVFDQNGKYLRDFGRKGAGPGEFNSVWYQWIKDGVFAIYDPAQFRASTITAGGQLLDTFTRPGYSNIYYFTPVRRSLRSIYPLPDGRMVQIIREQKEYGTPDEAFRTTAVLVSSEGDSLRSFNTEWMVTPRTPARGGRLIYHQKMYYADPALQADLDRGILIADPREPIVRRYDLDGNLSRILRLGLDPEPVTREEKDAFERSYRERIQNAEGQERERLVVVWQQMVIPDHKPYWRTILVDDQGYYWLRNLYDWTLPTEVMIRVYSYKVFSPEGEYLGSATWPTGNTSSITRGHLLGRKMDEDFGGWRHFVYRITPTVEGLEY